MRIGFCGAHGTGKSTLVDLLIKDLPNHKRYYNVQRALAGYLDDFGISSKADNTTQTVITSHYCTELLREENLIADRTLIDTFAYADLAEGVTDQDNIRKMFSKALELYDVVFYTPIEFNLISDGVREMDEVFRRKVDDKIKYYLDLYGIDYIALTGTIDQRYKTIHKTIKDTINAENPQ